MYGVSGEAERPTNQGNIHGRKPKVELLARGSEAETRARQTGATMEGVRTAEKSEGQRNWVELTG